MSDKREVNITSIIFKIKSLNVELQSLNTFKNSTGTNSIKSARQNNIRNQNKPCAFQVVTALSTSPNDSNKR